MIAEKCRMAAEGTPRTLLLAVTAPDPEMTPDSENASPQGFWINTIDSETGAREYALVLGAMLGLIEKLEHDLVVEFGDDLREVIDDARGFGHAIRW